MKIDRHRTRTLPRAAFAARDIQLSSSCLDSRSRDSTNSLIIIYLPIYPILQWKVRRTLAFSIHELAVILGSELAHSDLVPIFNGFIKDLDEVRIGVLTHLADFLKVKTLFWDIYACVWCRLKNRQPKEFKYVILCLKWRRSCSLSLDNTW